MSEYHDINGTPCSLYVLCRDEPEWAKSRIETLLTEVRVMREALEGWMMDHGDRCRICMDRSQKAIKGHDSAQVEQNHE